MSLAAWTLSYMRPYRMRMAALAVIALLQIALGLLSAMAAEAGRRQRPGRPAAACRAAGADLGPGRRRPHRHPHRRRGRRPAAAAVRAGRRDGEHAGAGRHRPAHGLFAARAAAHAPAVAFAPSSHLDADRRLGLPPRGRRLLRARPGDERHAAAGHRCTDAQRDVHRAAQPARRRWRCSRWWWCRSCSSASATTRGGWSTVRST